MNRHKYIASPLWFCVGDKAYVKKGRMVPTGFNRSSKVDITDTEEAWVKIKSGKLTWWVAETDLEWTV